MRCGSLAAMAWRFGLAALVGAWTASSDIDVSITGVYRDDAVLDYVSRVPGFPAKAREDAKLDEDCIDQPARLFLSAMEVVI